MLLWNNLAGGHACYLNGLVFRQKNPQKVLGENSGVFIVNERLGAVTSENVQFIQYNRSILVTNKADKRLNHVQSLESPRFIPQPTKVLLFQLQSSARPPRA